MSDQNGNRSTVWDGVIRTFLNEKRDSEEEVYLKAVLKNATQLFASAKWFDDDDIEAMLDPRKNKKGDEQTALGFQRQRYTQAKSLQMQPGELDWHEINNAYQNKISELEEKYAPSYWIANAAPNANSVSFASHVAKLTHSKIDSPSLMDEVDVTSPDMLTTSSLKEIVIDGAVAGNQYAPVFQFLELVCDGKKLAAEFTKEKSVALKPFARDDDELQEWNMAFKKATVAGELSSHALLKQVYFPVDTHSSEDVEESAYHLLTHMTSSSMAQAIFNHLFNDQHAQVKKQYDKGKYSPAARVNYSRRAKISVTASNHSNASQLNGRRGGKLHLLSAQPPTWTRQLSPPLRMKSWFDYGIPNYAVYEDINYLREFLLRFERLELSTRDPERRKWIEKWATSIVDEVLYLAGTIQALPAGWSDDPTIKLKEEHRYFLDPYRKDESFISRRESSDWQSVVCQDFATWLNKQLIGADKKFTPQEEHSKLWVNLIAPELRELGESFKAGRREATVVSVGENS